MKDAISQKYVPIEKGKRLTLIFPPYTVTTYIMTLVHLLARLLET